MNDANITTKFRPAATSAMERANVPSTCGCCGREELKKTVKMVDASGAIVWMGTGCAARAMGVGVPEYRAAAKVEQKRVDNEEREARIRAYWQSRAEKDAIKLKQRVGGGRW